MWQYFAVLFYKWDTFDILNKQIFFCIGELNFYVAESC